MTLLLGVRGRCCSAVAVVAGCKGETRRYASVLTRVLPAATAAATVTPAAKGRTCDRNKRQSPSTASSTFTSSSVMSVVPEPYLPLDTGRAAFPFILSHTTTISPSASSASSPIATTMEDRRVRAQRAQRMLGQLESTLTASGRVLALLEQRERALSMPTTTMTTTATAAAATTAAVPVTTSITTTTNDNNNNHHNNTSEHHHHHRRPAWMAAGLVIGTVTGIAGYQAVVLG